MRSGVAALWFGGIATLLQLLSMRLMHRAGGSVDNVKVYGIGLMIRLCGVVLLGLAVTGERVAPVPAAIGYLGTVLPLLYLETRPRR